MTTGPQVPACGGDSAAAHRLAVLQGAVLDCSTGTGITLPGNGASYLVVPNLAAGEVQNTSTAYVIGATGVSATASLTPLASAAALATAGVVQSWAVLQRHSPGALQRRFDTALLRANARRFASAALRARVQRATGVAGARASVSSAPPPPVGSFRAFHVIANLDTVNTRFQPVTARLEYVGTNILVYVDTAAPASFTAADYANFAATFDQVLYPLDVNTFGPPSDIDQNGRLIMLLTPVVNGLTPSAECDTQGYVAGFFSGGDLVSADSSSNQGEIFYALAPDPTGKFSCAHPLNVLEDELGATFLHELQHLINFSQHVLVRNSDEEEGWLDEGLSLIAEELGSLYYENKFPPPSGRTNPIQIFPDSAEGYVAGLLGTSYDYLLGPDTTTLTLHSDADGGLNWRAGDWLLLRYLGDQKGGATFYKALVQSPLIGIANIEAAAGEPFPGLFGSFSTAVFTDSLPGLARGQVPARDRFTTRNLRRLYARVATTDPTLPFSFPIQPKPLPATGTLPGSLVPGTMSFYRATASTSASTITITFASPSGGSLPAELHPQVSVFRLPPGI